MKSSETTLNYDMNEVSEWLKANSLSLNVKKSKLLFSHSKQNKFDTNNLSIKIDGSSLKVMSNT